MKKRLAATLAGIMAAAVCASPVLAEGVTINVTTTYAGEDSNAQNFKDSVAAWEEESGNKVEDSSATSDESFKSRIITDFEAGSEPDVLFFFNGVDANQFVEQGKVVSIDEIREEYPDYASNMKDDMLGASPADGVNYSVPVNGYWEGMFVNKEVLEEAGVEVPGNETTWDEFLEMCEAIREAGYTPIAASLQEIPHYWFEYAIYNFQSPETHNTVPESADDEYGQAWTAGLNDIKALYEAGYFPENTLTASDAETVELFNSGEAAYLIDGSWKVGYFTENAADLDDFAIAYVPGKGERKASEAIGGISMGYFITTKAWDDPEKREAAVEFISQLTSDEVMSNFVTTEVTALVNGASPAGLNSLQQSAADANANITAIAGAVQDTLTAEARGDLFANIQNVVTGKMTAEEAIDSALALN